MGISTTAIPPSTPVTEIPSRFSPIYVVNKTGVIAGIANSTTTNSICAQLFRADTAEAQHDTPTTPVEELGTNFHVGEYDDIADAKLHINSYDVGPTNISLLTGKAIDTVSTHVTHFGFNDLATAVVDVHRQFADPNGNVFASMFMSDLVISEFGFDLKKKSAAMEDYQLQGFNMMLFRGFTQTKIYNVLSGDQTAGFFVISGILGTDEQAVALNIPSGGQPASYWIQRGCYNFLKIERYRPGVGFLRFKEVLSTPTVTGTVLYTPGTFKLTFFGTGPTGDINTGDIFFLSYGTYKTNVANYKTIPTTTADSSDPVAVPTRLTPFTIAANNVSKGSALSMKMALKRDRAEGIGDVDGVYGPPNAPEVQISLDVNTTDMALNSLMQTGSPLGTDNGGTVAGDYVDPNYWTRVQLGTATPVVAVLYDPRASNVAVKTYTIPTAVFKSYANTSSTKGVVTSKYSGMDRVGNVDVAYTHP